MSDQTPPPRDNPLPLPPAGATGAAGTSPPFGYHAPGVQARPLEEDSVQRVFDTVAGPNVRLKDNLLQLVAVIVGAAAGIGIGRAMAPTEEDQGLYMMAGAAMGLVVSVVVSGVVIGIIRGRRTPRR
jgi:hypothetical protein